MSIFRVIFKLGNKEYESSWDLPETTECDCCGDSYCDLCDEVRDFKKCPECKQNICPNCKCECEE